MLVWLTTWRSAVNAKVAFKRITAARSRARKRAASRREPTFARTGVAFSRCNGGLDRATNAAGSLPKPLHLRTRSGSESAAASVVLRRVHAERQGRRCITRAPRTSPRSPRHDGDERRCRPHRSDCVATSRSLPSARTFRRYLSNSYYADRIIFIQASRARGGRRNFQPLRDISAPRVTEVCRITP